MLTTDTPSLNQAMADPLYQLKSKFFSQSSLGPSPSGDNFRPGRAAVLANDVARFRSILTSDPAHMMPGEKSRVVMHIQFALKIIFSPDGLLHAEPVIDREIEDMFNGSETQRLIRQFKTQHQIRNFQGMIDPIVGKKTMRALDFILSRNGK